MKLTDKQRFRFWSKVAFTESCWLWMGPIHDFGYGRIYVKPNKYRVHRFSWELHNGPIPDGMCVCHKCDVTRCVNPAHLFLGTKADNLKDMHAKGRNTVLRGEDRPRAKLTEAQVMEARKRYIGGENTTDLSEGFGVCDRVMWSAITGRTWKHLPGAVPVKTRSDAAKDMWKTRRKKERVT